MKYKRQLLIFACGVGLILAVRGWLFHRHLQQPLNLDAVYALEVSPGTNLTRIVRDLQADGIMGTSYDLLFYARVRGVADRIRAGEYRLDPGMSAREMLERLVAGEVNYHQIRLQEGWTLRQALDALQSHPAVTVALDAEDPASLQAAFDMDVYPEGWFFPDTYNFTRGTTDLEILERAHALMREVLAQAWSGRAVGLPYGGPEEALVLASIIEKESAVAEEREQIAGVFVRRLQRNMRLQTDPTVIYGLGAAFDGNLTRAHLQQDTPWNTYTRNGLPPTPIALPGRAAIEASLHPDASGNLYFVARGDGSHYFSATLEEHNRAVAEFQTDAAQE